MIDAVWLVLAARAARILAKNLDQAGELCGRDCVLQRLRELDVELLPRSVLNPAARCIRVAVRKRNVGLNVVDGRAIAQVGPSTWTMGPLPVSSTRSSLTQVSPMGLGRNGLRVANTPTRSAPPRRGGRTVFDHLALVPDLSCDLASAAMSLAVPPGVPFSKRHSSHR